MFHTTRKIQEWFYTLFNHRKIIKDLEEEVGKDFEIKVTELHQTLNSVDATVESPFLAAFVDHMIQIYESAGGENYLSMSAARNSDLYEFTIQRKLGKSPAQKSTELEEGAIHRDAEIHELKEKLRSIANEVEDADEIPRDQIKNKTYSRGQVKAQNDGLINIHDIVLPYTV